MDPNEVPPPPYSAVDPLLSQSNSNRNVTALTDGNRNLLRLRGGDAVSVTSGGEITTAAPGLPVHFTSAAAYFVERPPPAVESEQETMEHHMTVYPRSQSKDFPRRPRCWSSRMENISQQDWDMFLRHLFPPHLGLASSSAELPRQVRAEIQRDRKDRPQETDEERERRIAAVMAEWNQCFFEPRAAQVVFFYVTDPRDAPVSPLCPRCYPAATRASQETRSAQSSEVGSERPSAANLSITPAGYPNSPSHFAQNPAPYGFPASGINPAPFFPPHGAPPFFHPGQPPHAYPYPAPYQQYPPWGWGGQQHQSESFGNKGGPLGWISALAAQAQKYGERISEQAQQYGDQISAHAQHYGRQVEEHAMAHGRWIEEQTGLQGRKVEPAFSGWSRSPRHPAYYPPIPSTPNINAPSNNQPSPQLQNQRIRRASVGSSCSESSLSSIDSLSTTSELSSSDLATVRAQLLSLNDHHNRDLYDAAVELRRQLEVLRDSRRQERISCRSSRWRNGWGHQSQNSSQGRGSWGRWESPQDRQRNQAEKRAVKEEMRATRKAFRDVLRRARDEQHEQRRMKKNRQRQERRSRRGQREEQQPAAEPPASLEQSLQNLDLNRNRNRETMPQATSLPSAQRPAAGSESSAVNATGTPSIDSSQEGNGTKEEITPNTTRN
ncbi:hypothetical protein AOCH_004540 [Aspergillus ochraceoroseus]|nr:hypothetical protein AOCH_004540 [Aspergillus ochraceoroseus]